MYNYTFLCNLNMFDQIIDNVAGGLCFSLEADNCLYVLVIFTEKIKEDNDLLFVRNIFQVGKAPKPPCQILRSACRCTLRVTRSECPLYVNGP